MAASFEWLAMAAGNIANANDPSATAAGAYRTQSPVMAPVAAGSGRGQAVAVTQVALGPPGQPAAVSGGPSAGSPGAVFYPTDSLASQLTQADMAGLAVQANAAVLRQAVAAYQSLLGQAPAPGMP